MERPRDSREQAPRLHSSALRRVLAVCAAVAVCLLLALGTWQVYRLQWKLDLIAKVDTRVHAAPVAVPGPAQWAQVNAANDEYRHVVLTGVYLPEYTTRVQATTDLGSGYWLLTPLCLRGAPGAGQDAADHVVIVNRGFIGQEAAKRLPLPAATPAGKAVCATVADRSPVTISGLLRMPETGRAFLRLNDPANHRWYARDVAAIGQARGFDAAMVAPFFVDAGKDQEPPAADDGLRPVGGLTVISFTNNHLVYALTWYALAAMAAGAFIWVARDDIRQRQRRKHNI
ncbi:SURF1 family protein [Duganella sp. FT92W]|uniref:SURF1-like protein n=1 Tax=Pseudoduganella rivuli TaxID=2666085 RepID=A0A7X2IPN1_9BURK|nr:SURF1 family protein [Pseudoduganella rivuli]MRV73654.1 SURF1 family protein [Pseudoduganella rivuli]